MLPEYPEPAPLTGGKEEAEAAAFTRNFSFEQGFGQEKDAEKQKPDDSHLRNPTKCTRIIDLCPHFGSLAMIN